MERYLSNYQFASRRLLSFLSVLFVRLNLGQNNFTWNVVRLCVRFGFYVRFNLAAVLKTANMEIRDGQIVCYFCNAIAYASLNEFVHTIFNNYNDRCMDKTEQEHGIVRLDSEFYHLAHRATCDRMVRDRNDLSNYMDTVCLRRMCAAAYVTNNIAVRTEGNYVCRICMNRTTDVSTLPCGHVYACFDCLMNSLRENKTPANCFICREMVSGIQQLYFA